MGSHYKKAIFQDKTAQAIHGWHNKAKQKKKKKDKVTGDDSVSAEKPMLESVNGSSGDGSNQGFEFSLTASSRNLLSHLKFKSDTDPGQQMELLQMEAGEAGRSDSAWVMDDGSVKHRADQDETGGRCKTSPNYTRYDIECLIVFSVVSTLSCSTLIFNSLINSVRHECAVTFPTTTSFLLLSLLIFFTSLLTLNSCM